MSRTPGNVEHQTQRAADRVQSPTGNAVLDRITHAAICLLPASAAVISLIQDGTDQVVAANGLSDHPSATRALPAAVLAWSGQNGDAPGYPPIIISDVRRQADSAMTTAMLEAGMVALVVVPLLSGEGKRVGALAVADAMPRRWVSTDIEALEDLAAVTSVAIDQGTGGQRAMDADEAAALARLRRSFDDGLAGHAVATANGQILACNPEFARIAGFASTEEAIGSNLHSLEPAEGAFHKVLERLKESGLVPLEELRFVRRDGTPSQVLARLAATRDGDGAVTEIRVYLVDITQRFLTEQKLRESAERLALIELATQDVLWDWDLLTGKLIWNDAIARRFRYTSEEVQSTADWHIEKIHPDDRERVLRSIERAVQGTDTHWSDEYRFLRGDGSYAAVLDRAHLVRNARGEPIRVIGAILDISELRSSEEAQRLLARASTAFESGLEPDSIAQTLARIGVPSFADACIVDLFQPDGSLKRCAVAHSDPQLEPHLRLALIMAEDNEAACMPLRTARSGTAEFGTNVDQKTCAALCIDARAGVSAYAVVPLAARGKVLGSATFALVDGLRRFSTLDILTAKDLARRAGLALDNAILYDTVHRAVRARNEVLGIVSHDLRVPVNVIGSSLSMLKDTFAQHPERSGKLLDVLGRATAQMTSLIEDLLDASRLESEQFHVDRRPVDVASLIHESCEMLRIMAGAKDISIEEEMEDGLPLISVDGAKLARVIGNLLGNAIKFSPHGSPIHVRAQLHDAELHVSVTDHGDGIPQEQLAKVFDRFWSGRTLHMRGAGLGLAIARGIVEAHGGRIWAHSVMGEGSTFTFALPLHN